MSGLAGPPAYFRPSDGEPRRTGEVKEMRADIKPGAVFPDYDL